MSRGPYDQIPDHQFWRKSVAALPPFAIDPMVSSPIKIARTDKVATAGSCFAQHIAAALRANGLAYYVVEGAPEGMPPEEARQRQYGVFSCRYGNIYTARQLLQLVLRAYGRFEPELTAWRRADGRFVDPFRPAIEPTGYATIAEVEKHRAAHLAAVRRMFETLDVFIFTFGQTECWRASSDGAVLPVAPGVVGGEWDGSVYEFCNMTAHDVADDFLALVDLLQAVNAQARLIVTVSPVPLAATYVGRHALVSNCYTKAALRVAVDDICRARPEVVYFPAYEMVTAPCNAARFYEDDQRNITALGIAQVARVFLRHFADGGPPGAVPAPPSIDVAREGEALRDVVCEEDFLDQAG